MAGINHLHLDEPQPNLRRRCSRQQLAKGAASVEYRCQSPAPWCSPPIRKPHFSCCALSSILWTGRSLLARARPRLARRRLRSGLP